MANDNWDDYQDTQEILDHTIEVTQDYDDTTRYGQDFSTEQQEVGTMHDYRYPVYEYNYELAPVD